MYSQYLAVIQLYITPIMTIYMDILAKLTAKPIMKIIGEPGQGNTEVLQGCIHHEKAIK